MARYRGPRCRLSRREGVNLGLKKNWDLDRRDVPPGQHGFKRSKLSDYGIQLREKQKAKRFYGILERQFRKYYEQAAAAKGVTGVVLLQKLELRLDNVIYQMGYALTRSQGRQMVGHGLVHVNGKRVNIPSYHVQVGDQITFTDKAQKLLKHNVEVNESWAVPGWLSANHAQYKGEVMRIPEREDITIPVNEQLIVELYSK